jgi:hypothetical protein
MNPSIDYDHPESIPAAERAISLLGQTVTARVQGPMDPHPIVGVAEDWGYEGEGVVVYVDDECAWVQDVTLR